MEELVVSGLEVCWFDPKSTCQRVHGQDTQYLTAPSGASGVWKGQVNSTPLETGLSGQKKLPPKNVKPSNIYLDPL